MKYVISILTVVFCAFSTNVFCSQGKELKVKTMKTALTFYFTDQKAIADIKAEIEDSEGIPAHQQRLIKQEGWAFGFPPKRIFTELADNQTCGFYDLRDNQEVNLWLKMPKSQAQRDAELQARRQAITATLLQKPFSQPLVTMVAAYDSIED